MNAWNFIAGFIAGGIISIVSVILGAAIATTAINGKKHDAVEREHFLNATKENS